MPLSIEFVEEDGTGLSTATSYVSLDEFRQYWLNRGVDYTVALTYPDATIKGWLNNATSYVDINNKWCGDRSTATQALEIPRDDWYDIEENDISGTVPDAVKNAVCEIAAAVNAGKTSTFVQGVRSKSYPAFSVSYSGDSNAGKTTYPAAETWLKRVCREKGLQICRF